MPRAIHAAAGTAFHNRAPNIAHHASGQVSGTLLITLFATLLALRLSLRFVWIARSLDSIDAEYNDDR